MPESSPTFKHLALQFRYNPLPRSCTSTIDNPIIRGALVVSARLGRRTFLRKSSDWRGRSSLTQNRRFVLEVHDVALATPRVRDTVWTCSVLVRLGRLSQQLVPHRVSALNHRSMASIKNLSRF